MTVTPRLSHNSSPNIRRALEGFDDLILSLYSRGLTVREIQSHLQEIYQVEVAPDFISTVTEAVAEAVNAWRNRPLEAVYPVVWFDALMVKIRPQNQVQNRAVYLALALNLQGHKEVLGAARAMKPKEPNSGSRLLLIYTHVASKTS